MESVAYKGYTINITEDSDSSSPRNDSNLGYFITCIPKRWSPDTNDTIKTIIEETSNEGFNLDEHMEKIKAGINEATTETVLAIYPITKYEHGGITYSIGRKTGFDDCVCGFYIITDKTQAVTWTEEDKWKDVINGELEVYNQWCNGEVYWYQIAGGEDDDGEDLDACYWFYGDPETSGLLEQAKEIIDGHIELLKKQNEATAGIEKREEMITADEESWKTSEDRPYRIKLNGCKPMNITLDEYNKIKAVLLHYHI